MIRLCIRVRALWTLPVYRYFRGGYFCWIFWALSFCQSARHFIRWTVFGAASTSACQANPATFSTLNAKRPQNWVVVERSSWHIRIGTLYFTSLTTYYSNGNSKSTIVVPGRPRQGSSVGRPCSTTQKDGVSSLHSKNARKWFDPTDRKWIRSIYQLAWYVVRCYLNYWKFAVFVSSRITTMFPIWKLDRYELLCVRKNMK